MSISLTPGVPGPHLMQAAFIVEDLDAAIDAWIRTTGIGPFFVVPNIVLTEFDYRGQRSSGLDFSVAIAQSGGVQIELIQQHSDGPSAYRDLIAKGHQGFHHFCIYTSDYDATRARYLAAGAESALDGLFGEVRFCYIDTSPTIGCMIELVEEHPLEGEFFARIAEAAKDWDGVTNPIRPAFPA